MGAKVEMEVVEQYPEPVGRVRVRSAPLKGVSINANEIPFLIDEIPVLSVLAAYASGATEIHGAEELRVKESDRIERVADNLRRMGVLVDTFADGLKITGGKKIKGAKLSSFGDHRIAMSFAVGALGANGDSDIEGEEVVSISYPDFFSQLRMVAHG
jgi:3-phosphoshikimate 1-carboxyvinyltransferase